MRKDDILSLGVKMTGTTKLRSRIHLGLWLRMWSYLDSAVAGLRSWRVHRTAKYKKTGRSLPKTQRRIDLVFYIIFDTHESILNTIH